MIVKTGALCRGGADVPVGAAVVLGSRAEVGGSDGLRTLAVEYDDAGSRHRDFRDSAAMLSTSSLRDGCVAVDVRMAHAGDREAGPHAGTPPLLVALAAPARSGRHEALSRMFEIVLTDDQVNIADLCSSKLASRRYQLVEQHDIRALAVAGAGGEAEDQAYEDMLS